VHRGEPEDGVRKRSVVLLVEEEAVFRDEGRDVLREVEQNKVEDGQQLRRVAGREAPGNHGAGVPHDVQVVDHALHILI
jgi:hypothetical protein